MIDFMEQCLDPETRQITATRKRGRPSSALSEEERKAKRKERDSIRLKKKYAEKRQAQIEEAAKESSRLRNHPDGFATLLVDEERTEALSQLEQTEVEPVYRPILPKSIVVEYDLTGTYCNEIEG